MVAPSDLPGEQPTEIELSINLGTAKAASCRRSQKCSKSVTAPRAAEKASPALTCDFGAVCEPPVGSKTRTTASQNVIRTKNHIAQPCFPATQPSSQPQVACVVGSRTAVTLGQRAQAGAKMLYEFLSERLGSNESSSVRTPDSIPLPQPRPDM